MRSDWNKPIYASEVTFGTNIVIMYVYFKRFVFLDESPFRFIRN